jgi:hypothetical protein
MENQEEKNVTAPTAEVLQIAMLGYDKAIQLWEVETASRHSEYNTMLVANSLILAAIGFSYQTTSFYPPVKYFLPIVGLVICLVWYMSGKRAVEQAVFYIYCARELEGKFFNSVFQHLYKGHLFGKGEAVEFLLEGKQRYRRMKLWGRLVRRQVFFNFIILIFAIMYISVLVIEII